MPEQLHQQLNEQLRDAMLALYLAHVLPASTTLEWASLSQHIAAGKLDAPGLTVHDAQTALRSGAGWAMLFAGLGASGLALLSRHFFRRER